MDDDNEKYWHRKLALFGDSSFALFCSFSMFVLSFLLSLHADGKLPSAPWNISPSERAYRQLEPLPSVAPAKIFSVDDLLDNNKVSSEMQKSFDRDGVIAVRGLLDPALLSALDVATAEIVREKQDFLDPLWSAICVLYWKIIQSLRSLMFNESHLLICLCVEFGIWNLE